MSRQDIHKVGVKVIEICVFTAIAISSGCQAPGYNSILPPQVVADRSGESSASLGQYRIAGWSVEKRPVMLQIFGEGSDVSFIMAGIHGDEVAGTALVRRLAAHLNHRPDLLQGKTVLLMALANPDGTARQTRQNVRGVDLNRNFPANNRINSPESGRWALSEPESRVIYQILREYRPNRIVSVHQPLGCIDYDGPAADLAGRMAQACDLPVKKLGARPGSMGSYSSQVRHIPIVTLELLDSDSGLSEEQLWTRYGRALVAAIQEKGEK
jgi:murein peptide amidase A